MNRYDFYSNLQSYKKNDEIMHYGIIGQKWGKRRWQNSDGTFNAEGKERYFGSNNKKEKTKDSYHVDDKLKIFLDKNGNIDYSKYDLEELKKYENECENKYYNKYYELHENNWRKEIEYGRKNLDNIRFLEIKMAKENDNVDYDAFSDKLWNNTIHEEDERLEHIINHDDEYNNAYKQVRDKYYSRSNDEDTKKARCIMNIMYNEDLLKGAEIHSELIDKAKEYFKNHDMKIDEQEQMEWAKKEHPEWNIINYKNNDNVEHKGLEKEFNSNKNKIKIKIQDRDAFGSKYAIDKGEEMMDNLKEADEKMKQNIVNALWSYRFNLFKENYNPKTYRPEITDKQKKYMFDMSKEEFTESMEKQILPKLKLVPKDIIIDNNYPEFKFEYKIDGLDKGSFTIPCYSDGSSYAWNVEMSDHIIELDDLLK